MAVMNKLILKELIYKRDYVKAINLLNTKIKEILVKRIQSFLPGYQYCNMKDLQKKCFLYLGDLEQEICVQLYGFHFYEFPKDFELKELMEIYKKLTD